MYMSSLTIQHAIGATISSRTRVMTLQSSSWTMRWNAHLVLYKSYFPEIRTNYLKEFFRNPLNSILWIIAYCSRVKRHMGLKDEFVRTPLLWAAGKGHKAIVQQRNGVDIDTKDKYGQTLLSVAARGGQQQLMQRGNVDINAKDWVGCTLLLWAAGEGHDAVVRLLIRRDVDNDIKDEHGRIPLP